MDASPAVTFEVVSRREDDRLFSVRLPSLDPIRQAQATGATVLLPNGDRVNPAEVVSVARRERGQVQAAWLVRVHGLDGGTGPAHPPLNWKQAWQEVGAVLGTIRSTDPAILSKLLARLDELEAAFHADDGLAFLATKDALLLEIEDLLPGAHRGA